MSTHDKHTSAAGPLDSNDPAADTEGRRLGSKQGVGRSSQPPFQDSEIMGAEAPTMHRRNCGPGQHSDQVVPPLPAHFPDQYVKGKPGFRPEPWYNPYGRTMIYQNADEAIVADWIDPILTLYRSAIDRRVIGVELYIPRGTRQKRVVSANPKNPPNPRPGALLVLALALIGVGAVLMMFVMK